VTDDRLAQLCAERGVPVAQIGRASGDALEIAGQFSVPLAELRQAHESTLPALFD
jgi:phosphoribosylformylglycinamidine synthase